MRKSKGFHCPMAAKGLSSFFQKDKTFRPKRKYEDGTMRYELHKQSKASLHAGIDLKECVKLPKDQDLMDWVAVHVVDFYNRINLIVGGIEEVCSEESCPTMSGGKRYEYHWCDKGKYKKPTSVPAIEYISLLMDWIESLINNEDIFPVDKDIPFPKSFLPTAKKILTRLFRVFVHIYMHHFERLQYLKVEAHVNQCYKHFYFFVTEYSLVEAKELEPLREMSQKICW